MSKIARIEMPDGRIARFEVGDDTTPEQAQQQAMEHFASQQPAPAPAEPSGFDTFKRRAGILARGAATGVGGTIGAVGDALNTGINMAAGTSLGMPSESIQGALDQLGLPEAQTGDEKFMEALASFGGGMVDPLMTGITGAIARQFGTATNNALPNVVRGDTIRRAQAEGYKFSPNEAGAGVPGRVVQGLTGGRAHDEAANWINQGVTDKVVRRAVGLPDDAPLTPDVLRNLMDQTYQSTYEPVRAIGQIPSMPGFRQRMADIMRNNQGASASFPGAVRDDVTNLVNGYNVPQFDSSDAVDAIRGLRQQAKDAIRTGNGNLGEAQRGIATALEDNIEEYLTSQQAQGILHGVIRNGRMTAINPQQLIDEFRAGRTALAKQHAVDEALVEGSGSVDAMKLAQQLRAGKPLTDDLRMVAETANIARPSMHYPQAGKPKLFSDIERYMLAGAFGGSAFNPAALGTVALPVASAGIRRGMMSDVGQGLFAQPKYPTGPIDPRLFGGLMGLGTGLYSGE